MSERPRFGDGLEQSLRCIAREEIEKVSTVGETRIREIVREEMARLVGKHGPLKVGQFAAGGYGTFFVSAEGPVYPKPKTDLERAAGIILEEAAMWNNATGCIREAWALTRALQRINALKPSPGWRKIAEGLEAAVREEGKFSPLWARTTRAALEAYENAVKEAGE